MLELILATTMLIQPTREPEAPYHTLIGWQVNLASKVCGKYGGIEVLHVGQVTSFVKCNNYGNMFRLVFQTEIKEHIKL